jgi:hypothetical protein
MTNAPSKKRKFEDRLRTAIASALHEVSAYRLPAICDQLRLAPGEANEAMSGKVKYVTTRIQNLGETDLLLVANNVLDIIDSDAAAFRTLRDLLDEHSVPAHERISELTRRTVLSVLDGLAEIWGDLGRGVVRERLEVLGPTWKANVLDVLLGSPKTTSIATTSRTTIGVTQNY